MERERYKVENYDEMMRNLGYTEEDAEIRTRAFQASFEQVSEFTIINYEDRDNLYKFKWCGDWTQELTAEELLNVEKLNAYLLGNHYPIHLFERPVFEPEKSEYILFWVNQICMGEIEYR